MLRPYVDRLNELARLKKERDLTEEELQERDVLRRKYIDGFKENLSALLENVYIENEDGEHEQLQKKRR